MWYEVAAEWVSISSRLLVIHYEDLLADPVPAMRRMVRFYGVPEDRLEPRLGCIPHVIFYANKRPAGSKFRLSKDMFDEDIAAKVDAAIIRLNALLLRHGHDPLPLDKYFPLPSNGTTSAASACSASA